MKFFGRLPPPWNEPVFVTMVVVIGAIALGLLTLPAQVALEVDGRLGRWVSKE